MIETEITPILKKVNKTIYAKETQPGKVFFCYPLNSPKRDPIAAFNVWFAYKLNILKVLMDNQELIARLKRAPYTLMNPQQTKSDLIFKAILVGDSAVGKSALMNRVTKNDFTE